MSALVLRETAKRVRQPSFCAIVAGINGAHPSEGLLHTRCDQDIGTRCHLDEIVMRDVEVETVQTLRRWWRREDWVEATPFTIAYESSALLRGHPGCEGGRRMKKEN